MADQFNDFDFWLAFQGSGFDFRETNFPSGLFYDRQGDVISLQHWGELRDQGLDPDGHYGTNSYVRVREDHIGDLTVSTVWMGIDHGWCQGRPVIFESMIFNGATETIDWLDDYCARYCTEAEALIGHQHMLTWARLAFLAHRALEPAGQPIPA